MIRLIITALVVALQPAIAYGQTPNPLPPFAYAVTVGTAATQVIGANPARKRLLFVNPSSTASVAVCPPVQRVGTPPTPIVCAVNGAGSVTIPPLGVFTVDGGAAGNASFAMSTSWNGVASAPSSPLTILESE